ncbi:MAG: tetratricopeptide repeat protein [Phycisphaerae bacterium]
MREAWAGSGLIARMLAAALAALGGAANAVSQPTQYVNSREIVLSAQGGDAGPLTGVDVWITTDRGASWRSADVSPHTASSVTYAAPGDGTYGFFMILRNAAGASSDPPAPGESAQLYVVVDATPPTLQIHEVVWEGLTTEAPADDAAGRERDPGSAGRAELSLRLTVADEHLAPLAVRVFYRGDGNPRWENLPSTLVDGRLRCAAPAADRGSIDIRVIAQDRAGNTATDERRDVRLENLRPLSTTRLAATTQPTTQPHAGARGVARAQDSAEAGFGPLRGAAGAGNETPLRLAADLAGAGMRVDADEDALRVVGSAPVRDPRRAVELRGAAKRFVESGRFELAIARLEEALEAASDDPEALVELGACLVRVGRHDEARARYETVLRGQADHVGALEGLALVEATQRRYREARDALAKLCVLQPERGQVWLNRGDIEYRLGNTDAAHAAWKHVLAVRDADDVQRAGARRRMRLLLSELPASTPVRGP